MIYRSTPRRCTLCPVTATVATCRRCDSPVCALHTPLQDQCCDLCELDWIEAARPQRTVSRPVLLALVLGWCATAFLMANGCYIASMQWVGSAVFAGFTVAFIAATQRASFGVHVARWRFLRETVAGPRPLAAIDEARSPDGCARVRRRPAMGPGASSKRWKLQSLCR